MITKNTTVNTSAGATRAASRLLHVLALAERVEPQEIGVEARQPAQAEEQHHQDDDRPDDPAAEAESAPGLVVGTRIGRAA